ncbi:MAG: hypothetical protein JWM39_190 [Parcubacteria group bacterium]|jgi:hypothetical protein|nr:hypothetical protein [Parcubacteria group bacterium]
MTESAEELTGYGDLLGQYSFMRVPHSLPPPESKEFKTGLTVCSILLIYIHDGVDVYWQKKPETPEQSRKIIEAFGKRGAIVRR